MARGPGESLNGRDAAFASVVFRMVREHPFRPCSNWKRVDRAVRYLAGWNLAPAPDLVKPEWPKNGLRHSHASYAVASGASLDNLLFECAHTSKTEVLRSHYVGRASKKQATEFFAIRPGNDISEDQIDSK